MARSLESKLENCVKRVAWRRNVHDVAVRVERATGGLIRSGSAGDLADAPPFFIASATKLLATATEARNNFYFG